LLGQLRQGRQLSAPSIKVAGPERLRTSWLLLKSAYGLRFRPTAPADASQSHFAAIGSSGARVEFQLPICVDHQRDRRGGGEVARYIGRYGTSRVARAVLIAAVPPIMLQTDANPKACG
jgi:hypothetical protein